MNKITPSSSIHILEHETKVESVAGAILCLLGFMSAIIVSILDRWGVKQLGDEDNLKQESKKLVSYF